MSLQEKLKAVKRVETPQQRVVPIVPKDEVDTVLISLNIPTSLRSQLRLKAVTGDTTITELILNALYKSYKDLK